LVQQTIDPREIGNAVDIPVAIVPPQLRQFGHVPDFRKCEPGDLVLSRSIKPGCIDKSITRAQKRAGFADEDSQWTHAAVFLYDTFVAEAIPRKGVRVHSLYNEVLGNVLRVRRSDLTDYERSNLALRAATMLGVSYSVLTAFRLGLRMNSGLWNPGGILIYGKGVICSKIFFDAHLEIASLPLKECPLNGMVTPAHLSATPQLDDVQIPWIKL
jgi:hypothetical protein